MRGYGKEWAEHFYVEPAAAFIAQTEKRPPFAVTRLISETTPPDITNTIPAEDSFLISVALKQLDRGGWDHWFEGKELKVPAIPPLHASVFDLRGRHVAWVKTPFDYLHFNIPRETVRAFTDDHDLSRVTDLKMTVGANDPVIANLSRMILPYLHDEQERSELFLDHFGLMLCARLVEGYTSSKHVQKVSKGGLAPWQKRRAEELLEEHLGGNLRLERLARECDLSPGHFARAFKTTFGVSVHRWIVDRRIDYAKALLAGSKLPLIDIACRSGFSGQSTFTRAFLQRVGVSPGHWRRNSRSAVQEEPLNRIPGQDFLHYANTASS